MDLGSFVALAFGGLVMLSLRLGNILLKWTARRLGVEETSRSDGVDEALTVATSLHPQK
jgi:hypothetical protein